MDKITNRDACERHILGTCKYLNQDYERLIKSLAKMEKWFSDYHDHLYSEHEKCGGIIAKILEGHMGAHDRAWVQFQYLLTDLGIPVGQSRSWRNGENIQEKRHSTMYYDTDIGRFISLYCTREMDSINFDCVQVRVSKKRIRIIEAKKEHEPVTKSEKRVLGIFKSIMTQSKYKDYKVEVCTIRGTYPFTTAEVYVWETHKPRILNQNQLIKFLNFEHDYR